MNRKFHQEYRVMRINPAKKEKKFKKLRKKFNFFSFPSENYGFSSNSSNSLDFIVKV